MEHEAADTDHEEMDHDSAAEIVPELIAPGEMEHEPSSGTSFSQSTTSDSQASSGSLYSYTDYTVKEEIEYVTLPINRTISTHKYCFVCSNSTDLVVMSLEGRLHAYMETHIFIPKGNRCCGRHLIKGRLYKDELSKLKVYSNSSSIDTKEIASFLNQLCDKAGECLNDKIGNCSLSEEQLRIFTGFTYDQLDQLRNQLSSMRNSEGRSTFQALVTFLLKMRTGNSNKLVAAILGLPSEQMVSDYSDSVIKSFNNDVLPTKFDINNETRDNIIQNHTSPYVKKLFNYENKLVLVYDGTYVRHQKSSNNAYQRKSYSVHKKSPLCKPFTICATDGFVVDVAGPFNANKNDAEILRDILKNPSGLSSILKKGDVFILDRGFRDIKRELENNGYIVLMPAQKGKRKQLTTEESNQSRFVTKLRWVVEAVHGIIGQKFKILHDQLNNKLLPRVRDYCRIACYLNNCFGQRLNADSELFNEIASEMLKKKDTDNGLSTFIEDENLQRRRKPFQKITSSDIEDFPEMTVRDLEILFTGRYQMKQAISYLAEVINEDGTVDLSFVKDNPEIVRFLIRSRHISSKTYKCFVQYKSNSTGRGGIVGYTCECANGLRTIGTCSHVATVIYYLSHARYQSCIIRPAEILTSLFDNDKLEVVINEDSDDD